MTATTFTAEPYPGTGYPAAFVITAAAMLAALAPARRDRRTSRSAGQR